MRPSSRNFRYRNRQGAWLDFHREGLALGAAGSLELVRLPKADPAVVAESDPAPGAIAVAKSGEVYFTRNGRIAVQRCTGEVEEVEIDAPRAMALSWRRGALLGLYADRLVVFDLPAIAEAETWFGFDDAHGLAVDEGGRVYIGDTTGVQRYFLTGQRDPSFRIDSVAAAAVAVTEDRLFILEEGAVRVFDTGGHELSTVVLGTTGSGLAAAGGTVYVGDDDAIAVLQAGSGDSFEKAAEASGYTGPVAALAVAGSTLWAHPGAGDAVPLTLGGAYGQHATLYSAPLDASGRTVAWGRVRAWLDLPETCDIQFHYYVSDNQSANPQFPDEWEPVPAGVTDFYVGKTAKYIGVGAVISGDGSATVRLHQIRTDFDHEGYTHYLPEIFSLSEGDDRFLDRFLGAFESLFDDADDRIAALTSMVDAEAIAPENLDWLAGFLALNVPEAMSADARRAAIRGAFESYALRGTAAGLRNAILVETGVHAVIQEPFALANWWEMPARSPDCSQPERWVATSGAGLGAGTVLSGASPNGAVLGSGAVLDQSHLITNDEFGMSLFGDVAHRFNVLLYDGEVACPEKRAAVEAVIEREKPAHTAAHVCVVQPKFRIGWQSILGIETVIGGAGAASRLGEGALVLGGAEAGRLGESATVGVSTRL